MRILVLTIGLIFCFFPYTQIIPIESYNQPYALVFCGLGALMSFGHLAREFPHHDLRLLSLFAVLGIVLFLATCMPDPNATDFKSLLAYLSPLVFCMAGFAIARLSLKLAYRVTVISAIVWFLVGLVQTLVSPTFATQFVGQWNAAAVVVVESGRGVLGLAPEPTHYGFHMLLIATALVILRGQRLMLPGLCVLATLFLARSSSAILAMVLGSILYLVIYTKRARIFLLAVIPGYFLLGVLAQSGVFPEDVRLFEIIRFFYSDPTIILVYDASVNNRIGGIIVGIQEILRNNLLPYGMSNDAWVKSIGLIMARNSWLIDISDAGIPSGILIVIYQAGIFGVLLLLAIFRRLFSHHRSLRESWFISVLFFIFMSQYSISAPGFGIIYGLVLARHARRSSSDVPDLLSQAVPVPVQ